MPTKKLQTKDTIINLMTDEADFHASAAAILRASLKAYKEQLLPSFTDTAVSRDMDDAKDDGKKK